MSNFTSHDLLWSLSLSHSLSLSLHTVNSFIVLELLTWNAKKKAFVCLRSSPMYESLTHINRSGVRDLPHTTSDAQRHTATSPWSDCPELCIQKDMQTTPCFPEASVGQPSNMPRITSKTALVAGGSSESQPIGRQLHIYVKWPLCVLLLI